MKRRGFLQWFVGAPAAAAAAPAIASAMDKFNATAKALDVGAPPARVHAAGSSLEEWNRCSVVSIPTVRLRVVP